MSSFSRVGEIDRVLALVRSLGYTVDRDAVAGQSLHDVVRFLTSPTRIRESVESRHEYQQGLGLALHCAAEGVPLQTLIDLVDSARESARYHERQEHILGTHRFSATAAYAGPKDFPQSRIDGFIGTHYTTCRHTANCPCRCRSCTPRTADTPLRDIASVLGHSRCCVCKECLDYLAEQDELPDDA